ncbi:MAG: PDGLE domain-containing protein [Methanobacterium sp.]|nr:PDGLE domain-containing protein [Methanobacterium sp.]
MNRRDKLFVTGGILICLMIVVFSSFFASPNPDGLEKSAENFGVNETQAVITAPFPDYGIEGLDKIGEIGALVIGILVTLGLSWLVAILIRRKKQP